jgi:hypothetical protein
VTSANAQVKSDERTLAATLGELVALTGGGGELPMSVPVSMAGTPHTLTVKDSAGRLSVWFASDRASHIKTKFEEVDRVLQQWATYVESLGNPAVKEEFEIIVKPEIEAKKTSALQNAVNGIEDRKSKEYETLKKEIGATITALQKEIEDWATKGGIEVRDFSDAAVKERLERATEEAAEQVWRDRKAQAQTALEGFAGEIQALDANAHLKYRGSLAKGRKGVTKDFVPFSPMSFDVDLFVQSDKLFMDLHEAGFGVSPDVGELAAERHPDLKRIMSRMEEAYNTMEGVRAGSFSLVLRTSENTRDLLRRKGTREFAGETHVTISPPAAPPPAPAEAEEAVPAPRGEEPEPESVS